VNKAQVVFDILARDRASKTMSNIGRESEKTHGKLGKFGKVGAAAFATAGVAAVAFGKKSVDTYQNVGRETLKLQRYIGGTAEDASRLRFAAQMSGLSVDDLAKGLGKFSKSLVGASDKTKVMRYRTDVATGAWKKQTTIVRDAAGAFHTITKMVPVTKIQMLSRVVSVTNPLVAKLGFAIKDAHGKLLPMSVLLPKVADKFKEMPNGTEKTALALTLFGKSGMTLLPFLNKGAKGIEELTKQSDKLGNTMSGKDLDAIKAATKAKREWQATITGVQIQLGRYLFPAVAKVSTSLLKLSGFVERNGAVMKPLIATVAVLAATVWAVNKASMAWAATQKALAVATKVLAAAQWVLNAAMRANPILLVVTLVAALAAGLIYAYKHSEKFRNIVDGAFKAISSAASFMWNTVLKPIFRLWLNTWFTIIGALVNGAASAFGWVPGLGGKLKKAAAAFNKFRDDVNRSLDGVKDKTVSINVKTNFFGGTRPGAVNAGLRASGGPVTAGRPYIVGEREPELFVPNVSGQILNGRQMQQAFRGAGSRGGDAYYITVHALNPAEAAQKLVTELRRLKRQTGQELGLA
jgi:hypothetical protein